MSLADKLGNIYTNLNTALSNINSALIEKGGNEVDNILSVDDEIRGLEVGGESDELAMGIIDGSVTSIELLNITSVKPYIFFQSENLESVIMSSDIVNIGEYAFYACSNLKNLTVSGDIEAFAFMSCKNLETITFLDTVTRIGNNAFNGCKGLTNIAIGVNVTTIGNYSFSYCSNLTIVTIPNKVTVIDSGAFSGTNLSNIYLNSTTPPTLNNTNAIPSTTTIHVPIGSGNAYKTATNWSTFADNIVEDIVVE